jgi:hypothetical protein
MDYDKLADLTMSKMGWSVADSSYYGIRRTVIAAMRAAIMLSSNTYSDDGTISTAEGIVAEYNSRF